MSRLTHATTRCIGDSTEGDLMGATSIAILPSVTGLGETQSVALCICIDYSRVRRHVYTKNKKNKKKNKKTKKLAISSTATLAHAVLRQSSPTNLKGRKGQRGWRMTTRSRSITITARPSPPAPGRISYSSGRRRCRLIGQ